MSVTVNGTNGLTFADGSTQATGFVPGMRNRIINGDMRIDQRNAGASVTQSTSNQWPVDRFIIYGSVTSKFSAQQNAGAVTPPVGFTNYLGITSLSAYSIVAGDIFVIQHKIEGFNISDFGWGTANAQTVTLSFWVRSSLTGTFGGALGGGQAYPFTYTINAANTWEQKTITVSGSTSGTWQSGSSTGVDVRFGLGVGSTYSGTPGAWSGSSTYSATGATSVVGTNGATFYITGVQLEKGSVATPFEYRQYGQELALCQRYFCKTMDPGTAPANSLAGGQNGFIYIIVPTTNCKACTTWKYPVTMRSLPTITTYGYGSATTNVWRNSDNSVNGPTITAFNAGQEMTGIYGDGTATAWTAGLTYIAAATASAEL